MRDGGVGAFWGTGGVLFVCGVNHANLERGSYVMVGLESKFLTIVSWYNMLGCSGCVMGVSSCKLLKFNVLAQFHFLTGPICCGMVTRSKWRCLRAIRRFSKNVTVDDIVDIGRSAMIVTLLASAPMLLSGMVVGLLISIFQSVTQIQEITLTFVPKIVVVLVAFVIFLPWMSDIVLVFVRELYGSFDTLVMP